MKEQSHLLISFVTCHFLLLVLTEYLSFDALSVNCTILELRLNREQMIYFVV